MLIKYEFVTGEKVEIEVSNDFGTTMLQIETKIKNSNRRESRRHQSLTEIQDSSEVLVDDSVNVEDDFLKTVDFDKLRQAISQLKPQEQELIHRLYLDKHPMTQAEYAKSHNISYTTLRKRTERLRQKLKSTI